MSEDALPWRFIGDTVPRDGAWNMAIDEALYTSLEGGKSRRAVLRLYEWAPPCLSTGHHQDIRGAADERYLKSRGFDIVRRPTGGKAVLHQHEITYCVTAPLDVPQFWGGLHDTYQAISEALAEGLRLLSIRPALESRGSISSPRDKSPCFLAPTPKELLVDGRKVIGSAQRRGLRAFLQHGSIPLQIEYETLALATGNPLSSVGFYRESFAGLRDFRPGLTVPELREAIYRGFRKVFDGDWSETPLTAEELGLASKLRQDKYLQPDKP